MGSLYVGWLLATTDSLGFTRDEGIYFYTAAAYAQWFERLFHHTKEALTQAAIDPVWQINAEHPSLMKSLFSLSWLFFYKKWGWMVESTSFRFPGMCMAGLSLAITYLLGTQVYNRRAAVMAACFLACMPRIFFHAHLACFDIGVMMMWTLCIFLYGRFRENPTWIRGILFGVGYGLTLETKHNAWMLPAVFFVHALLIESLSIVWKASSPGRIAWRALAPFLFLCTLGPFVFVGLWPWLWHDPLHRFQEYVSFHWNHPYYNIEFLGRNYFGPPSPKSYVPVMVVATVPMVTLCFFLAGAAGLIKRDVLFVNALRKKGEILFQEQEEVSGLGGGYSTIQAELLLLLSIGAAVGPFFLKRTPIFGGTKHWFPAYPSLAVIAGSGFDRLLSALEERFSLSSCRRCLLQIGAALTALAAPFILTYHSHPFGLSFYAPFVGGVAGGADLGLNRQFWGFTTQSAARYLANHAPRGARVYFHDTIWMSWEQLLKENRIRSDLRGVGIPSEADFALVQHELHMAEVDYQIWVAFGTVSPASVVTYEGVPILSIYRPP
ncbi:hypothetical protein BCY86_08405 [Pajaroellobacter abortibovis]|uniref:Glycosyltransferase RgtA/B/C/D-like domain-containing protein n=2 Tax=Pajaroellobacter abortibovis TaxID=1882918 RepID=A0A1L6MYW0_9BACT|nr:hypothetical protein BCY86_08405 [Pajaroellobacter abortibovis]